MQWIYIYKIYIYSLLSIIFNSKDVLYLKCLSPLFWGEHGEHESIKPAATSRVYPTTHDVQIMCRVLYLQDLFHQDRHLAKLVISTFRWCILEVQSSKATVIMGRTQMHIGNS